jgi:large repetitive protein
MTTQKLPGGITQITELDNVGEPVGLRYEGQVTTVNDDGTTTVDPNGGWLSWSIDNDVAGRVTREWTPDGAAFTGPIGTAPGDAIPYDRAYNYDAVGRLVTVKDRTASATGVDITDTAATPCITRTYGFDRNDNRLTKGTAVSGSDGACTATGATTVTRAFDTADRPVTGANGQGVYEYDPLGRTTTIPASDASRPDNGDTTITYYDNDLAHSITQGGDSTTYTIDALDRRATETITTSTGTSETRWHYTGVTDSPAWVSNETTTQRYVNLLGAALALVVNESGTAELMVSNNHGDVVTTVQLAAPTTTATTIDSWSGFDEYGRPFAALASADLTKYEWLGAHQRATSLSGLTLMGRRLYNSETGLFTSVDPIFGGNANSYTYPTEPIKQFDLDGCWCRNYAYSSWYEYSNWKNFAPKDSFRAKLISWATGLPARGLYVISEVYIQFRLKWHYGSYICNGRLMYKHYWHDSAWWYQYRIKYKRTAFIFWDKIIYTYWGWLYP